MMARGTFILGLLHKSTRLALGPLQSSRQDTSTLLAALYEDSQLRTEVAREDVGGLRDYDL